MDHEGGGVVGAGLEAEGEAVLSGRDEAAAEVVEHTGEARDDPSSGIPLDLYNLIPSPHIVVSHRLVLPRMVG